MNGPAVSHACPPRDDLERFCRGDLSSDRLEELAEHLESCGNCQSTLEGLTAEADDLLTELRRIPAVDQPEDRTLSDEVHSEMASLESSVAMFFTDTIEDRASPITTEDIPQRLDEYAILEPIGSGGMGAVYRAVHTRLDKIVAIKVLSPHRLSDAAAASRFQREMKAVGKLSHPNIVLATDAGEFAGAAYLVMELVEGMDLARLIERQGRLHVAEACELVRQAALGLHYAHSHGLVHRDVKPSNLLLTLAPEQPSGGLVKLADLGLARLGDIENEHAGQATSANLMIGSLDYMAPEQADDAHRVDQRADLYSLGCTLYELLSGKPPFAGPGRQTRLQKMKAHADAPVPSLVAVCPNLPAGLEAIVRRLLAKDPAARFSTAAELAAALAPLCDGANLGSLLDATSPPVPLPRLSASHTPPPPGRHRSKGIVLGCLGALLAASVIYVQTDRGTLEIKSDDDEVKVRVEQDGKLVTLVDLKSNKEIRLRSGTYDVALGDTDTDLALAADEFTLHRGGKEVLHIRRQPPALLRLPFDADEAKRHQQRWVRFRGVPQTIKNDLGLALTLIPPGEFEMRPGYQVTITRPYYLGTHEVTLAQFRRFAEASGHKSELEQEGRGVIELGAFKEVPGLSWRSPTLAAGDDYPVAGVTWFDAKRFCAWLSEQENKKYRLPTEAEWEWAERVGTTTLFIWGDDYHAGGDYEWNNGNSEGHTHPVGQKRANAWGLHDVNGNVVEWCADWYLNPLPQAVVSDPAGPTFPAGSRLLRGGSFQEASAPFTNRGSFGPASSMIHCGFRVCREL